LSELDRILLKNPDERRVMALLSEMPPRVSSLAHENGTTRVDLLRSGARAKGVMRELVVRALECDAERETLVADLVTELGSSVITRRSFACLALRRLFAGQKIGPLAVHAVLDPSDDVRDGAILALRDANDPKACGAVVQALANPSSLVRTNAADALGRMGYKEAVEPLVQLMVMAAPSAQGGSGGGPVRSHLFFGLQTTYVKDFNVEIAQGASIADPIVDVLQSGVVFDVGVGGVSSVPVTQEVWYAGRALTRLTGERHGTNVPAWKKWWDENRARYVPGSWRTDNAREDGVKR
jgi:hypothetical protein